MLTITKLARQFNLSRSTLLYYDQIGLLKPSDRSGSNYRTYSQEDTLRLERICLYRRTGLPLQQIKRILDATEEDNTPAEVLQKRLEALDGEIRLLREQQKVILDILKFGNLESTRTMTKEKWTALLRAAGLDDLAMHRWHREFERLFPKDHREFLESLGICADEIQLIRAWSKLERESDNPRC